MADSMTTKAAPVEMSPALLAAAERVNDFIGKAKAPNTLRGYASDWRTFAEWCAGHGRSALPAAPETLALYLSDNALRFKVATLERHMNAINYVHGREGYGRPSDSPGVREFMRGLRRERGTRKEGKAALSAGDMRQMVGVLPDSLIGKRDRALLLLGFAGALRRSELTALRAADIRFVPEGMVIVLRRSKTDQDGAGQEVGVAAGTNPATCPVTAMRDWLEASGIVEGPLFRPINRHGHIRDMPLSGDAVARMVQARARQAGIAAPTGPAPFGAHSLRAGHATTAATAGVEERTIMRQGRWKSERTVRNYIRHGTLFTENSSSQLGL